MKFLYYLQIVVIHNTKNGKPRGYAFIEYEHERDMHCEYFFIFFTKLLLWTFI